MIEARIEELIQLEIDGQNPPEISRQLRAILETDPDAQQRFTQLQSLTHDFDRLGLVATPDGLRADIHRDIEATNAAWAAPPARRTRRGFSSREIFSFATGLAAGVVIFALLGRTLLPGGDIDPASLSGSMVPNPHSAVLPVMDQRSIHTNDVDAEARVRSDSDFVVAEIDLRSPGGLELVLEFDSSDLALVGCERPAAESGELFLGTDRLTVSNPQDGPYRFIFRKRAEHASSPLQLRLDRGAWSVRESLGITPPPGASPG